MPVTRRRILQTAAFALSAPALAEPPSIAALQSMRDRVRPIDAAERQARLERARELMRLHKLDAMLLTGGSSLLYFTAAHWGQSERFFSVLIPAKGNCLCVCPSFEEGRAREQLERGPLAAAHVLTWAEDENPYRVLASGMQSIGLSTAILGVDERTPFVFSDAIAKAAPQLKIASATSVTAGCRMLKSPHELELMQIANQATLQVYQAVYKALAPGMTQRQAGALISAAYDRVGFRGEASVEVGSSSSLPHGSAAAQIIREGQVVMIDDGCTVEGYNSDITRTFVYGTASDEMKRVFDTVRRAQKAALETARPGVECQAVDAAARKVISDAGYGPGYKYFAHRLGHGIGLDGHEWPYLVRGNTLPLAAGMTFSDEPGVYLPGKFGIRLEDDMHITPDGAKLFTPPSRSLEDPFLS
jgi:Xaa-Pro dipeptidase